MKPVHVLVIANPAARHLKLLSRLPDSTTITVGNSVEAFDSAIGTADVLVNGSHHAQVLRALWGRAARVQWVHALAAGVEQVLFPELCASPVPLTNSRGIFSPSLGEFAMAGILHFSKDLRRMVRQQEAGRWEQFDIRELRGLTLGIIGYGTIGQETAKRAKAFDMRVLAVRRRGAAGGEAPYADEVHGLERMIDVIERCDYVMISTPLTADTRGLIGARELAAMKPDAVFLNLGRGPTVVESALLEVLRERRIRGAVLDVFDVEPLPAGHEFYGLDNVLLSPHCADHTDDWQEQAVEFFLRNFDRFVNGQPLENLVDKGSGY
ncbi:MAG: D-2-hydroxyacid dehydrogenase [Acidobacteria bacterium]|nr:D-2-hydroxyacid dehydrogenase [Acidobacteriota bacterium]